VSAFLPPREGGGGRRGGRGGDSSESSFVISYGVAVLSKLSLSIALSLSLYLSFDLSLFRPPSSLVTVEAYSSTLNFTLTN
jgi:hypothetical protein